MTEDEYWESNGDYEEDDEIIGEYLIDETDDDLTLVMFPKIEYDFNKEFDQYYKILKKCRTKEQMKYALSEIIGHATQLSILKHELGYIQDRVKDLEYNVQMLG